MTVLGAALVLIGATGAGLAMGYVCGYGSGYIRGEESGRRSAITGALRLNTWRQREDRSGAARQNAERR
jgi:hypothetical protein